MTARNSFLSTLTKTALTTTLAILFSTVSFADDDIQLGVPGYGGNGCPAGTASVTISPDQKSLSILFDQYLVEAGSSTGKSLDRKSCNLAIPVKVPQGYSISVFQVDYRGFVAVPFGGRGQFNAEYFFAGMQGPRQTKTFVGGTNSPYELTSRLGAEALVWSACGADVNLRVNTSMLVQSNSSYEDALATVDSADVTAGLVYHFQWRRCF